MKRVLIIAYFFPPVSNMGSHRILRFVRHLRDCGWEPVVLTGKFGGWTEADGQLLKQIPKDVEICRVGNVDLTEFWKKITPAKPAPVGPAAAAPPRTGGLKTFLNRWVMVPDKYFPWIRPAAKAGEELVRRLNISAIYSTSDPLSDHLVARRIAQRTKVPWVVEFRDLWLGSPYFARAHPTPLHRAAHARLERKVVASAKQIVGLSSGIKDYYTAHYPGRPAQVIYNCFDPDEYGATPNPPARFSIVYAGALYSSRSPEPFYAGLRRFIEQQKLSPADAEFVIVGGSPDLDLPALAAKLQVTSFVQLAGHVAHAEALRRMQGASVLLAVQSPDDTIHVPGKLFEYVGARRPILIISKPCEVSRMILENNLGWVAEPDATAVAAKLTEIYSAWKTKGHAGLALQAADRFSVQATTRQLADTLEKVSAKG